MSKSTSFYEKYIKYKEKYINLQNMKKTDTVQRGGYDCNNDVVFKNIAGTCWMVALQTIFSFGDCTSSEIENSVKILQYRESITEEFVEKVKEKGIENMLGITFEELEKLYPKGKGEENFVEFLKTKNISPDAFKNVINSDEFIIDTLKRLNLDEILKDYKKTRSFNPYNLDKKFVKYLVQKVEKNEELKGILPGVFEQDKLLYLETLIEAFIERYNHKIFNKKRHKYGKKIRSYSIFTDASTDYNTCELVIAETFRKLFDKLSSKACGDNKFEYKYESTIIEIYLFSNLLSVFLLGYKTYFRNYYVFENILDKYDDKKDIGILIHIEGHMCCFFTCNEDGKYYNDVNKKIIDLNWKALLEEYKYGSSLYIVNHRDFIWLNTDEYNDYKDKKDLSKIELLTIVSKNEGEFDVTSELDKAIHMKDIYDIIDPKILESISCIKKSNGEYLESIKFLEIASKRYGSLYTTALAIEYMNMSNKGLSLLHSASSNNISVQLKLGEFYRDGLVLLKQNDNKAIEYLNSAAEGYNYEAAIHIINLYINKGITKENLQKIFKYIQILSTSPKILNGFIETVKSHELLEISHTMHIAYNSIFGDIYFKVEYVKNMDIAKIHYDVVKKSGITTDNMQEFYEEYSK